MTVEDFTAKPTEGYVNFKWKDKEFSDEVKIALVYVQNVLKGLNKEPEHITRCIYDRYTKTKAMKKIAAKLEIFETLEILCEESIKQSTLSEPS